MDLVEFRCPEHGFVLETYPSAIVHHAVESHDGVPACGRACVPADLEVAKLARKRMQTRERVARHRAAS